MGLENFLTITPGLHIPLTVFVNDYTRRLEVKRIGTGESMNIPPNMVTPWIESVGRLDNALTQTQSYLSRTSVDLNTSPEDNAAQTRRAVLKLFPCLKPAIRHGLEGDIFNGRKVEAYTEEAFREAKEFRQFLIAEYIPPEYHHRMELIHVVGSADNVIDLLKMYNHNSIAQFKPGDDSTGGIVYNSYDLQVQREVLTMLELTHLYSVVDLTRHPLEASIFREFARDISDTLPNPKSNVVLAFKLDKTGTIIHSFDLVGDTSTRQTTGLVRPGFIYLPISVRKFGTTPYEFVVLTGREKLNYSRMLKAMRGRKIPFDDNIAFSCAIGDKSDLDKFIRHITRRMKDWSIDKEEEASITPASSWAETLKYIASHRDFPEVKLELQIHWLKDWQKLSLASWIRKRYQKDQNDRVFRTRQLLDGVFQLLFPRSIYGINWNDPTIQKRCLDFAFLKAQESFSLPIETI